MKRIVLVLALFGSVVGVSSPREAEAGGYYYRRPVVNATRAVARVGVLYAWNRLYYSQMYIPRPPSYFGYRY
jgi:hypothetical protein